MTRRAGHLACGLAALLLLIPAGGPLTAQNTRTQQDKKARLEKEIAILDKQLRENASRSSSALSNLTLLRKKIESRNELVGESDRQIGEIAARIQEKQAEVDRMEGRLDTLSSYYDRLIRNAYKNRDAKVWYMHVLASEDLGQAMRRLGYLRNLSGQMNTQARKIRQTRDTLEAEKARLLAMKEEAQALRARRQSEVSALQKEEAQGKQVVSQLKKDRARYQKDLSAKKKQVEALNREIERIIREATKGTASAGARSSSSKPKTAIDYTLDAEFAKNKGKLPWPADGPVVEKYGQRNHPVYTNVKLPFNNGIGIALPAGTKVTAVFNGTVKQIVVMPGYNKCILVQHGNYFTLYGKLGTVTVKAGDKVKTGQALGTVEPIDGDTQLHFELWKGNAHQNPESWLR